MLSMQKNQQVENVAIALHCNLNFSHSLCFLHKRDTADVLVSDHVAEMLELFFCLPHLPSLSLSPNALVFESSVLNIHLYQYMSNAANCSISPVRKYFL